MPPSLLDTIREREAKVRVLAENSRRRISTGDLTVAAQQAKEFGNRAKLVEYYQRVGDYAEELATRLAKEGINDLDLGASESNTKPDEQENKKGNWFDINGEVLHISGKEVKLTPTGVAAVKILYENATRGPLSLAQINELSKKPFPTSSLSNITEYIRGQIEDQAGVAGMRVIRTVQEFSVKKYYLDLGSEDKSEEVSFIESPVSRWNWDHKSGTLVLDNKVIKIPGGAMSRNGALLNYYIGHRRQWIGLEQVAKDVQYRGRPGLKLLDNAHDLDNARSGLRQLLKAKGFDPDKILPTRVGIGHARLTAINLTGEPEGGHIGRSVLVREINGETTPKGMDVAKAVSKTGLKSETIYAWIKTKPEFWVEGKHWTRANARRFEVTSEGKKLINRISKLFGGFKKVPERLFTSTVNKRLQEARLQDDKKEKKHHAGHVKKFTEYEDVRLAHCIIERAGFLQGELFPREGLDLQLAKFQEIQARFDSKGGVIPPDELNHTCEELRWKLIVLSKKDPAQRVQDFKDSPAVQIVLKELAKLPTFDRRKIFLEALLVANGGLTLRATEFGDLERVRVDRNNA